MPPVVEMRLMPNAPDQTSRPTRKARAHDDYRSSTSSRSSSSSSIPPTAQLNRARSDDEPLPQHLRATPKWLSTSAGKTNVQAVLQSHNVSRIISWLKGPLPSRSYTIRPVLPQLQNWPQRALSKCLGGLSLNAISVALFVVWLVVFSVLLARSSTRNGKQSAEGSPVRLSCGTRLW